MLDKETKNIRLNHPMKFMKSHSLKIPNNTPVSYAKFRKNHTMEYTPSQFLEISLMDSNISFMLIDIFETLLLIFKTGILTIMSKRGTTFSHAIFKLFTLLSLATFTSTLMADVWKATAEWSDEKEQE